MTGNKYFVSLTHKQFNDVCTLLADSTSVKQIEKILGKAPQSTVNPVTDTQVINAIMYEGNILMDIL